MNTLKNRWRGKIEDVWIAGDDTDTEYDPNDHNSVANEVIRATQVSTAGLNEWDLLDHMSVVNESDELVLESDADFNNQENCDASDPDFEIQIKSEDLNDADLEAIIAKAKEIREEMKSSMPDPVQQSLGLVLLESGLQIKWKITSKNLK